MQHWGRRVPRSTVRGFDRPVPDGRPQQIRLRMVAYEPPPWWKQLLFHAKLTDDDPQPPIILADSTVNVAAAAPVTAPH